MRNLMRLTYAANKAQAWVDWCQWVSVAEKAGKLDLVAKYRPPENATIKKIDAAIGKLRAALEVKP